MVGAALLMHTWELEVADRLKIRESISFIVVKSYFKSKVYIKTFLFSVGISRQEIFFLVMMEQ